MEAGKPATPSMTVQGMVPKRVPYDVNHTRKDLRSAPFRSTSLTDWPRFCRGSVEPTDEALSVSGDPRIFILGFH